MPHQPPSSPGAWRSKKCRSLRLPQHSSVFAWGEGLSTFAPQQHRGPGCHCRPNRRRCTSHWQLRSTPRRDRCGPSALSRWRWLLTTSPPADNVAGNGVLEPGWESFASTRSARNPSKFYAKTKFGKKHGIKRAHSVSHPFNLWMVNFRSWLDEMYRNVMSNFVQWRVHLNTLQFCLWNSKRIPETNFSLGKPSHTCAYRLPLGLQKPGSRKNWKKNLLTSTFTNPLLSQKYYFKHVENPESSRGRPQDKWPPKKETCVSLKQFMFQDILGLVVGDFEMICFLELYAFILLLQINSFISSS